MAGQLQATTTVVGFAVLALIFPPLALFSGAALALVTLRLGLVHGFTVLGLSTSVMLLISLVVFGQAWTGLVYSLLQWLPLIVLALILRQSVSLSLTLQVAIALGLAVVCSVHLAVPDVAEYWKELLDEFLRPTMIQAQIPADSIDTAFNKAAQLMTGTFISSMLLSFSLVLMMARWWQALLYNPGGFRNEFLNLRLGYPAAITGIALFVAAILSNTILTTELAMVGLTLFFLQGVAIVHSVARKMKNPILWLIGFYVILIFAPIQMLAAVCVLGVIDTFANFRTRFQGLRQEDK